MKIKNVQQLNALPEGSVIRDSNEYLEASVLMLRRGDAGALYWFDTAGRAQPPDCVVLPADLLTPPEPAEKSNAHCDNCGTPGVAHVYCPACYAADDTGILILDEHPGRQFPTVVTDEMVEKAARTLFEESQDLDQENSWGDPLPEDWREAWKYQARAALEAALGCA